MTTQDLRTELESIEVGLFTKVENYFINHNRATPDQFERFCRRHLRPVDALMSAFDWARSAEGISFWAKIGNALITRSELNQNKQL